MEYCNQNMLGMSEAISKVNQEVAVDRALIDDYSAQLQALGATH